MTKTEAVERRLIESKCCAAMETSSRRSRMDSDRSDWAEALVDKFGIGKDVTSLRYPRKDSLRDRHVHEITMLWHQTDEENRIWDLLWKAGYRIVTWPANSSPSIEQRLDDIIKFLQPKVSSYGEWASNAEAALASRLFDVLATREVDVFSGRALEIFVDALSEEYAEALLSAAKGDGKEVSAGLFAERNGPSSLSLIIEVTNMLRTEHKKPESPESPKAVKAKKSKNK